MWSQISNKCSHCITLLTVHPSFFHTNSLTALVAQNFTLKWDICFFLWFLWRAHSCLAKPSPCHHHPAPGQTGTQGRRRSHSKLSHRSTPCSCTAPIPTTCVFAQPYTCKPALWKISVYREKRSTHLFMCTFFLLHTSHWGLTQGRKFS